MPACLAWAPRRLGGPKGQQQQRERKRRQKERERKSAPPLPLAVLRRLETYGFSPDRSRTTWGVLYAYVLRTYAHNAPFGPTALTTQSVYAPFGPTGLTTLATYTAHTIMWGVVSRRIALCEARRAEHYKPTVGGRTALPSFRPNLVDTAGGGVRANYPASEARRAERAS